MAEGECIMKTNMKDSDIRPGMKVEFCNRGAVQQRASKATIVCVDQKRREFAFGPLDRYQAYSFDTLHNLGEGRVIFNCE